MLTTNDRSSSADAFLNDVVVVEWGRDVATAYAGRMLADFGASVTRVNAREERRGDHNSSPERCAYYGQRKNAVEMDLSSNDGRDAFLALLSRADILLDDRTQKERDGLRLDDVVLSKVNPDLVKVSITPFGQTGPYSDFFAGDTELAFLSGLSYLTPRDIVRPDDPNLAPPLRMPGSLVSIYGGVSAAGAALTAVYGRRAGMGARRVDVSMLESLIPTLRREIALFQYDGEIASRFMRVWRLAPWGVKPCSDGYVFLQVVEKHHWEGLLDMMQRPAWALDNRYLDPEFRFEHRADIEYRIGPWLLTQTKAQFGWESQRRNLPFAPINELSDLPRIPQLHDRGFFRTALALDGRPCIVPGPPFNVTACRSEGARQTPHARISTTTNCPDAKPLAGLRVIDFGHVWAGPYCAALFADMGAEVIKVESRHRLDVHRRQGPYPMHSPGINRSGVWNAQNRGKRSVTLNLSTERGRQLARQLIATADVVIENFAPGVMQRLGLDYASLCTVQPDLVMASLSAFGQCGPQRSYVGYGPSLDAWAGLDALTTYEDGRPNALGGIFPDTGSALHAAVAILAALHDRDRAGGGCYIDLSELEVSVLLVADLVAESLNSAKTEVASGGSAILQGCYRCKGDDEWIAITIRDETVIKSLCELIGRPDDWPDFQPHIGGGEDFSRAIHSALEQWAAEQSAEVAMITLQSVGVSAGRAHNAKSLLEDPHLQARGFFSTVVHPEAGSQQIYGPMWRFDGITPRIEAPGPCLGQDNDYVLEDLLALSRAEIESLVATRVIY